MMMIRTFICILWALLITTGCSDETSSHNSHNAIKPKEENNLKENASTITNNIHSEKIKILVIQCSNGYEYAMSGYDFNPIIETELKKDTQMNVLAFPYKKLMGVAYQGVYDKKYAQPLIEKTDADIFIMTKFSGNAFSVPHNNEVCWGYETKILNTKTMQQKVSIGANKLSSYKDLEKDIIKNIDRLVSDISTLK